VVDHYTTSGIVIDMTNDFQTGDKVRLIGSPGFTGIFLRYYSALPSGQRNTAVTWDRSDLVATVLETQLEAAI